MGCSWKIRWVVVLVVLDVVLLIGCPILLIVFGVSLVKPYHSTRNFAETSCRVIGQIPGGTISCNCDNGPDCKSYFPCIEILVNYTAEGGEVQSGTVFDDTHNFLNYGYFSVTTKPKATKCSTYSCEGDVNHDANNVLGFINEYGAIGQSYTCYYNEDDPSEALVHKVSTSDVALGIALPLLFFILAVILGLFLYHSILKRKGEKVFCLGRKYEMEPNELSPPGALGQPVGESTF